MNARYIVTVPEEKRDGLQEAMRELNPGESALVEVVMGEGGRTAVLSFVEEFWEDRLRERYPQLRHWKNLDPDTRRQAAFMMADSRDWQFSDLYRVDWEEMYRLITQSCPDAVGPEGGCTQPGGKE